MTEFIMKDGTTYGLQALEMGKEGRKVGYFYFRHTFLDGFTEQNHMAYGSVEYMNDKKNNVDTEHFPGCLLALYICNSDLRRWKKAGGGVV